MLLNLQMRLVLEQGTDRRRYNLPTTSDELAAVITHETTEATRRDIVLTVRNLGTNERPLKRIDPTTTAYMPLYYVLLFLYRDYGWHYGLTLCNQNGTR
jgi:hypothetical protein